MTTQKENLRMAAGGSENIATLDNADVFRLSEKLQEVRTANRFENQGRTLLANGYLIVPIRKGEKRPAIDGWQKARLAMGDLSRYPNHGVGVLCGQGANPIVGVDIDVSHPTIGPALITWCQENLGYGGERIGAAPRILLAYRAAEAGWAKGNSVMFFDPTDPVKPSGKKNNQQVEILGLGQQFVAYHEHPDTGQDYEWVDMMGGLEYLNAADLPVVTEAQIEALLAEVTRLVNSTPGIEVSGRGNVALNKGGSDDLSALMPKVGMSFDEIRELVSYLKNEGDDYDFWLHVGAALHHEYADTDHAADALALWKEYGAKSKKDQPDQYGYKWRSFGKSNSTAPTTLRWLLKVSHQAKFRSGVDSADADQVAQSDVKIARLLAAALQKRGFVFEHGGRGWMLYKAGVYVPCALGEAMEAAKGLGIDIIKDAPSDPEKFKRTMALAQRAMSAAGIKAALHLAESDPRIAVKPGDFDTDPDLLNVLNGVVHLPTGELRPHDPAQFMSKQCPVVCDIEARAPKWDWFMDSISCGDREWVDFVQRAIGYSLSGRINEEVMFFLLGIGANGKSVFCNVIRRIIGSYVGVMPANFLNVSKREGEAATPTLASLPGSRIVQANEVEAGSRFSAQTIKLVTSTDAISARHNYGKPFTFSPTHTVWVRGNHKPIITDNDEGIWRRVVLIPFDRHFSPEEKDVMLEEKLMQEAPGILAWMVRGHLAYRQDGLRRARRVAAASLAYRAESDLVGQWIDERAIRADDATWAQADAYIDYRNWCIEQGLRPMAKKSMTTALIERGISCGQESTGGRRRYYRGLKSVVYCGFNEIFPQ